MDSQLRREARYPLQPYQPPTVQVVYVQEHVHVRPSLILGLFGFLVETIAFVVTFAIIMILVFS